MALNPSLPDKKITRRADKAILKRADKMINETETIEGENLSGSTEKACAFLRRSSPLEGLPDAPTQANRNLPEAAGWCSIVPKDRTT